MKVLYFHQHFSTPQGSTGTRSYEMAQALIKAGHEVTIVCGSFLVGETGLEGQFKNGIRRGKVDEIDVVELHIPYSNHNSFLHRSFIFLSFAMKSAKIAITEPYDLIFATSTPLTAGIPGVIGKLFKRRPLVFEVRDLWPELPRAMGVIRNPLFLGMLSCLEWLTYQMADGLIGLSPGIVKGIRKRTKRDKPISMIPNGCDAYFSISNIEPIRPVEVSTNDFLAIFTGAHGIANALHNVLYAASELEARGRYDIKFLFIGEGKKKKELEELSDELKLTTCMFVSGMPKYELIGYLNGADIGLMVLDNVPAFYYGTSPNKFFDYISSALPVITNYPGWLADIIKEYSIGYCVAPDDPVDFANQLELAVLDKEEQRLAKMGADAHLLGMREFNREVLSKDFVSFLEVVYASKASI